MQVSDSDQLVVCGEHGVYVIEGISKKGYDIYKNVFNITSSNIVFLK